MSPDLTAYHHLPCPDLRSCEHCGVNLLDVAGPLCPALVAAGIKAAYREGFEDRASHHPDCPPDDWRDDWMCSDARAGVKP